MDISNVLGHHRMKIESLHSLEMGVVWRLVIAFAVLITESEGQTDPCSATVYSDISDLAKRDPSYAVDSVPLCDRYISPGWYRGGFHKMATSAPSLAFCGTVYPFWLNGAHPPVNTISSVEVCKVGFSDTCSQKFNINVKNCSTYIVYELQPLDSCNSAYCFEPGTDCVSGVPTNLVVSYHSVSWKIDVQGVITRHDPSVNLKCSFTPLTDNSLFYDISWYVDDVEVVSGQTVDSASLDNALLSARDMIKKNKKAGSMIHCVVGAKNTADGIVCDKTPSQLFFAGIKVLTPQLTIDRGGSGNVQLQFTIPYTTEDLLIPNFDTTVSDLNVNLAVLNDSSVSCKDGNSKLCGIKVKGYSYNDRSKYSTDDWKQIHTIKIFNRDNGDYTDFDRHITLRLETGGTNGEGSQIFSNILLPDIQVYINEPTSVWKGSSCGSKTDPHMYSFDGYAYECQLDGNFILYRNTPFNQEVQVKHHLCHPSHTYPRCTCAVAVRSGRDIFTVDICSGNKLINFPLCEDKVLKVIRKNDKRYQVLLPTGTMVDISLVTWPTSTTWQIDISIYPSPSDVGNTTGLCGVLGDGINNDLTRRDNSIDDPHNFNYWTPPNDFSNSWQTPDNEDLFKDSQTVYATLKSISTTLARVCTCKETSDRTGEIECNYGTFKDCKFKVGKQFHCIINPSGSRRRKRDLTHFKYITDYVSEVEPKKELHLARYKRQAIDVTTREVAHNVCMQAFEQSEAFTTCQQYVSDLSNTTIENCILDVMMTGDNNITKVHIEAALEQCSTLVLFNTSFQTEQPEIAYQVESLCPNNCSENGICSQGNCTCNPNFAGSDCSFDLLGPPTISHISDFGLCDKSSEDCDEITLYGELFLDNMNTECYFMRRTLQEDGTLVSQAYLQKSLQPRTLFEGYCSLSYTAEPSWVTEFTFNVTNDGSRFTDSYNVYTYQSLCQEYQNTSGNVSFAMKDGYCFIDGKCYASGNTNPGNLCDLCNATYDKYNWTFNAGHCFINNTCYVSGAINGTNTCSACIPSVDATDWSDNPGYCYIDNVCYFNGQTKANNDCFVCKETQDRNGWTFNDGHCLIDGECFKEGENKTSESCKICNPLQDKNNWTLSSGYCSISNSCITDGESDISNPCLMCNASRSQYSLFPHSGYCNIGDLCIADGQSNGSKPCLYCNASVTRDSWSFNRGYCYIDGICVEHGKNDTTKECKICNTTVNSSSWQIKEGYCYVQDNCYRDSDMNSTYPCQICNSSKSVFGWSSNSGYCNIVDLCITDGQSNGSKPCLYCNASVTRDSWSFNRGYCYIDGICVEHGKNDTTKECKVCDTAVNSSSWQIKEGYCYVQDNCYKDSDMNSSYPCQICNSSKSVFGWSSNSEYCNINGLCVPDGQRNGTCFHCNTSLNAMVWSLIPGYCLIDGFCVEHGSNETNKDCQICDAYTNTSSWQLKNGYCLIEDQCFKDNELNATFPCLVCNATDTQKAWSDNLEYCNIGGLCVSDGQENGTSVCHYCNTSISKESWSFNPGYCLIDGVCVGHGENKTNMECHICDVHFNTSSWKLKEEYCNIDGLCVSNGQTNGTHPCFHCNTAVSKESWSFNADYCLIEGVCVEHGENKTNMECHICDVHFSTSSWKLKEEYCNIDGLCVSNGQTNGTHPCFHCNTSVSKEAWSFSPGYCLIDGVCVGHGENKTNMECHICDVHFNNSSWKLKDEYCNIDGLCVSNDQTNGTHPCFHCNTSVSKEAWSFHPDYCLIEGVCVEHGENKTNMECHICDVHFSTSSWKLKEEYCNIDGLCVSNGQTNGTHPCFHCNTSVSKEAWSFSPGYCLIDGVCVGHGENKTNMECHICDVHFNNSSWKLKDEYCNIDGLCVSNDQTNGTHPCFHCNTSVSKEAWSFHPDYCLIEGVCVEHGENKTNMECHICDVHFSTSSWKLKEEYCNIDGLCVSNGQTNGTHPCFHCNTSVSKEAWSFKAGHCLIQDQCFKDTEKNVTNPCEICNATNRKYDWTSNIDCLDSTTEPSTTNKMEPSTSTKTSTTTTEIDTSTTSTTMEPSTTSTTMEASTTSTTMEPSTTSTTMEASTTSTTMEPSTTSFITEPSTIYPKLEDSTTSTTWAPSTTSTTMEASTTSTTMEPSTTSATMEPSTTSTTMEASTTSTTMEPSTTPTTMEPITTSTTMEPSTTSTTMEQSTTSTTMEPSTTSTTMEPSTSSKEPSSTTTMGTSTTSTTPEPSTTTTDTTTTSITDSTTTPTETTTLSTCIGSVNITNVSVSYHNITWATSTRIDGVVNSTTHEPFINMKCSFASMSEAGLNYQIMWYIYADNRTHVYNETVMSSSGDSSVVSLMSVNRTLGFEMQCTVGLTRNPVDEPCSIVESERFFVGLKVLDNHLPLSRKGKTTVRFHLTVPYVTPTEIVNGREQPLSSLKVHATALSPSMDSCAGQIEVKECSVNINAHSYENRSKYANENWGEVYNVTLSHIDTDEYAVETSSLISLTTMENRNGIFNALSENITVLIEDRQDTWKGKSCGSKTDPHLYTFDGRSYENHIIGTFVLYQNTLYNQEIQTKHHQCHPDYNFPKCICAVSVQSGMDVFVIDICDNNQLIDFVACADGTLSFYRESDKVYKIVFPTGTFAIISLVEWPMGRNSWQIDVDVYPSLLDVNNTAGLCGTLDGNQDNDFTHRNGSLENYTEYPDTFSTSWIVPDDENLLNTAARQSLTSISGVLDQICTCSNGESFCVYDTYRQCTQTKRRRCTETANALSRKKRSSDRNKYVFTSNKRVKRQAPTEVKTASEAEEICTAQFEQSEPYKTCRQHVGDLSNSSLNNCIKDIVMTGDDNITSIHVEAALQQCVKFVQFNTTLQNAEPSVTYELTTLCPNNCSNKGICDKGNCTCLNGYGGSDCSFDILKPPTITRLSVNETCDKTTQNCSQVIIDGTYFLENVNNICFYTRQSILHDRTEGASYTSEYPLEAYSLFQGACPLVYDVEETWVTKFSMNISNDRTRFTESFYIYAYQSTCQQINQGPNDVYFTLKDNFCFMNMTCVPQHTRDSYNNCAICDPQRAKYNWSLHEDCVSATTPVTITTTESFTSHPIFLATISIAAAVCFLTVIIVGICCYRMKSGNDDESDSGSSYSFNGGYKSSWMDNYGKPIPKVYIPRARFFPSSSRSAYSSNWK
ncbi:uncharacterized protein LOC125666050 [Ostrea edulis]|uniref:uncharacterized protein LOC125666050 n=1 Tax=Ostrea edulis TaxID=37623 RepID=UPI0024AF584F|nr:uncharacterized protein LOC125666050 [Ostrea edulis]